MRSGDALNHSIGRRVVQHYLAILRTIDWPTFKAKVEFMDSPGLFATGRIFTVSGSGGTLYPPYKVGDVVEVEVTGHDLGQLMERRNAHRVKNPYLYDKSDVIVSLSAYMDAGEPAGRKAATPPADGGWLLVASDGSEIRLDPVTKEWVWKLPTNGKLYLGGKTNAKAVLVHGDDGGEEPINASQSRIFIGDP